MAHFFCARRRGCSVIDPTSAAYEFLQQADETLEEARILLKEGRPPGTINRSYYAAFYAASALLDSIGLKANSHQAAISLLHREFVRSGKLDGGLPAKLYRAVRI